MRLLLLPALLAVLPLLRAQEGTPDLRRSYDVEAYDLVLDVDPEKKHLEASTCRSTSPGRRAARR